jgi:hypothetical protein
MRGAKHLKQITQGWLNLAGYDARKLLRWINLAGGAPPLTGKDPAAHMLFIRDEYPDVYVKTFKSSSRLPTRRTSKTGECMTRYLGRSYPRIDQKVK